MSANHSECFMERVYERMVQEGLPKYSLSKDELDRLINIVEEEYKIYMKGREQLITINYCKEGIPYSDFDAETLTKMWVKNKQDCTYKVSTENIISYVRRMVAEGEIEHKDVQFQFNGQNLEMNEYAVIRDWKKGFCDYGEENAVRIIKAQNKKRRAMRAALKSLTDSEVAKFKNGETELARELFT